MSREESFLERYWRLRREADELYQRQMREVIQRINEQMRKAVQKELDAMEDAVNKGDLTEAFRHQMILEVLLR